MALDLYRDHDRSYWSHIEVILSSQEIDLPGVAEGVYTPALKGALPVRFVVLR